MTASPSSHCGVLVAGSEPVARALQQVSRTLGLDVDFQYHKESDASRSSSPEVGLTVSSGGKGLRRYLLQLHEAGVGPVIWMRSVPVATRDEDDDPGLEHPLAAYPASVRSEFSVRIRPVSPCLPRLLEVLKELRDQTKVALSQVDDALSRSLRACEVFDTLIRHGFGHGGDADITNRVLGPAYLLSTGDEQAVEKAWGLLECESSSSLRHKFYEKVIKPIEEAPRNFGEVGQTLLWAWTRLTDLCKSRSDAGGNGGNGETGAADPPNSDSDLARERSLTSALLDLMDALTECRIAAGEKTESKRRDGEKPHPPKPIKVGDQEEYHRLLVVDDHAHAWRLALEDVAARCNLPVKVDFSLDGDKVSRSKKEKPADLLAVVDSYDAVLLDVLLGTDQTGLDLLEKIRRCNRWAPVIIWTTSREADIPAGAVLASGFLFKKRATLEDTVDAIKEALLEGRARRDPLMNRFFDTVIRDPGLRACARQFERSCITVMDSFHALPHYRLFNDHAGRHILVLLSRLTELLRPFMPEKCKTVFSDDLDKRPREVFCLYVAALAHEMGMFPHKSENPREVNDKFEHIRNVHALRSLEAIWNRDDRGLSDLDEAIQALNDTDTDNDNLAAVAVLVGYHARLLSLKKRSFLKSATPGGRRKLDTAKKGYNGVVASASPEDLKAALQALHRGSSIDRERLRKQCALLRFADALDIDRSRQPVHFLLNDPDRDHHNLRENGKREVVQKVVIAAGPDGTRCVHLELDAPKPDPCRLAGILGPGVACEQANELINDPWANTSRDILAASAKPIEEYLDDYWIRRKGADAEEGAPEVSRPEERDTSESGTKARKDRITLGPEDDAFAAGLSALSVAAEVLEEYQAIEDCDLDSVITLRKVTWMARYKWQPRESGLYWREAAGGQTIK